MTQSNHNAGFSPLIDVLTREVVLINVSCRYWRGAKKLQAQDLGLDPDDVTDRLISLGHKKLLPREALGDFALIESRAHALIDTNTFPFLNSLGPFLPNRRLAGVTDKLSRLESEFNTARDAFTVRYGTLRNEAIRKWRQAAIIPADTDIHVIGTKDIVAITDIECVIMPPGGKAYGSR